MSGQLQYILTDDLKNVMDHFLVMLVTLEGRCNPDKDILVKNDVESGYKIYNQMMKKNLKPRWIKT
jgi:hypothetical protein